VGAFLKSIRRADCTERKEGTTVQKSSISHGASHGLSEIIKDKWELTITDSDYLHAIASELCMALQRDVNGEKKQKEKNPDSTLQSLQSNLDKCRMWR